VRKGMIVIAIAILAVIGLWVSFDWLGKFTYKYAYDDGWNANQKLNDQPSVDGEKNSPIVIDGRPRVPVDKSEFWKFDLPLPHNIVESNILKK